VLKQLTTGSINNQMSRLQRVDKIQPLHSLEHYYLNQNNQFIIQLLISPL
jgi:hypothetical protein